MVYAPDQPDLFARICGYFDRAGFSILDARVHTANNHYALDSFQVVASSQPGHYRELTHMVESDLVRAIEAGGPLPEPARKRVSRRVKSFPIAPGVAAARRESAALAPRYFRQRPVACCIWWRASLRSTI